MTAAPSLPRELETAAHGLIDAKAHHLGAVTAHAEVKRALELATARLLVEGVDGKNEAQRGHAA